MHNVGFFFLSLFALVDEANLFLLLLTIVSIYCDPIYFKEYRYCIVAVFERMQIAKCRGYRFR